MSAAIPAAWGVAADVPKKFGYEETFWHWLGEALEGTDTPVGGRAWGVSWYPRNVSLTPSGPTKSGFWRMTGAASRVPDVLNRMGAPPTEEEGSSTAVVVPHAGVWK